jgi:hypothetical protein
MVTLIYKGVRGMPPDIPIESVSLNVLGVGWVTGGVPFTIDDARAAELMAKPDLVFDVQTSGRGRK